MQPDFPPLLTGHRLEPDQHPARKAASGASKGKFGAGDVLWVQDSNVLNYAIVLEPDVDRDRALEMVFTQMAALGDAIGALAPPEVAITHHWPNKILANGAFIGEVNAILSTEDDDDGNPRHMVIWTQIDVRPRSATLDPGVNKQKTTLWDEGCGDLNALDVLTSAARHFTTWVHTWEEEGFQPVLVQIDGRMETEHPLELNGDKGTYLGLDESANLLLKQDNGTKQIYLKDALQTNLKGYV